MIQKVKDFVKAKDEKEQSRCDLSDIVSKVRAEIDAKLAEDERKKRLAAAAAEDTD